MAKIHTCPRVRNADSRRRSAYRVRGSSAVVIGEEFNKPNIAVAAPDSCRNDPVPSSSEGPPLNAGPAELARLYDSLSGVTPDSNPRTAKLLGSSTRKAAQKVIEEAGEVALEAVKHRARGVVRESADLLYNLVVLWQRAGVDPAEVWNEMKCRADTLGIAEKLPKPIRGDVSPPASIC
jgi:phosphoribosyl-ATP pyrophosphohydrolase